MKTKTESGLQPELAVESLLALGHATRLAIFRLLVQTGPTGLAAGEIAASLKLAPATLSFHVKELSRAGLVSARQDGRYIFYSAAFDRMNELVGFLTDNCCAADGVSCLPAKSCAPASPVRRPVPARRRS